MTPDETTRRLAALEALITRMSAQIEQMHTAIFPSPQSDRRQRVAAAKAEILTRYNKAQ